MARDLPDKTGTSPLPQEPCLAERTIRQPDSIISVKSTEDHTRIRRLLQHGFTESAVKKQEWILQNYVGMLIDRLGGRATSPEANKDGGTVLDMVQWLNSRPLTSSAI